MFSSATILTDELVRSAAGGSVVDRDRLLQALAVQVRAMVTARLAPAPAQFPVMEEIAQQALLNIAEGLSSLRVPGVVALRSFASTVVSRRVADYLRRSNGVAAPGIRSLDSTLHNMASGRLRDLIPAS